MQGSVRSHESQQEQTGMQERSYCRTDLSSCTSMKLCYLQKPSYCLTNLEQGWDLKLPAAHLCSGMDFPLLYGCPYTLRSLDIPAAPSVPDGLISKDSSQEFVFRVSSLLAQIRRAKSLQESKRALDFGNCSKASHSESFQSCECMTT